MSDWNAYQVFLAAKAQNERLEVERAWYDQQLDVHRRDLHALDGETEAAWQHLGEVLVPALDPAALDRAAAAFQLAAISAAAVDAGARHEADRLHRELAQVSAHPDYVGRDGIRVECDLRIAECDEMLAPWSADPTAIHLDPAWQRLRDAKYGTTDYAGKWYQLSYYNDWKQADELVERHGPRLGVKHWDDLRRKALEAESAHGLLVDERESFVDRRRGVEALVGKRAELEQALQTLPARALAGVRGRLRGHLGPLGVERIAELLPGDPAVTVALQRLSGLAAKRRYLAEAAQEYIVEPQAQVVATIARNNRDFTKLSGRKAVLRKFPAASMEKRFRDRSAAVAKRRQRWDDTRTHIVEFHHYDRGSLAADFLWWDLMTDGRLDGDYIPEVHDHHARYPDHDRHADAVAAVASQPTSGDDGLLIHDGS